MEQNKSKFWQHVMVVLLVVPVIILFIVPRGITLFLQAACLVVAYIISWVKVNGR